MEKDNRKQAKKEYGELVKHIERLRKEGTRTASRSRSESDGGVREERGSRAGADEMNREEDLFKLIDDENESEAEGLGTISAGVNNALS